MTASRSEQSASQAPSSWSSVVVTVKVAAWAGAAVTIVAPAATTAPATRSPRERMVRASRCTSGADNGLPGWLGQHVTVRAGYLLEFTEDPREFLHRSGGLLEADPVLGTVVASVTNR